MYPQSKLEPFLAKIPSKSAQSLKRAANALNMTKSSAEQVFNFTSGRNSKRVARSTAFSSKGNPPKAISMPIPVSYTNRSTRLSKANFSASSIRAEYFSRKGSINDFSFPKPVTSVKSTSCVTLGSPHRCNATPSIKQYFQWCDSQKSCTSSATWNNSIKLWLS